MKYNRSTAKIISFAPEVTTNSTFKQKKNYYKSFVNTPHINLLCLELLLSHK